MKGIYKLSPSLHNNIWGGNNLRKYGKKSSFDRIGESWELSFVKGEEARLPDGKSTTEAFGKDAWGENCKSFENFPVLTKFIDAKEKLSVQVHPDDDYALKYEGQYGKSEMWYVVDADEGAGLYMGLEKNATKEEFEEKVKDGTVEELLSFKKVKAGDVFFIPAGTIHAIGAGVLIYEIQQNSTLTYRLYDYMRRDSEGNLRPLHVEKAMKVSTLAPYTETGDLGDSEIIGKCKYFVTKRYKITKNLPYFTTVKEDSYLALTAVKGEGKIIYENEEYPLALGDTYFLPQGAGDLTVKGDLTLITVKT